MVKEYIYSVRLNIDQLNDIQKGELIDSVLYNYDTKENLSGWILYRYGVRNKIKYDRNGNLEEESQYLLNNDTELCFRQQYKYDHKHCVDLRESLVYN
jgi:hypothetical protein